MYDGTGSGGVFPENSDYHQAPAIEPDNNSGGLDDPWPSSTRGEDNGYELDYLRVDSASATALNVTHTPSPTTPFANTDDPTPSFEVSAPKPLHEQRAYCHYPSLRLMRSPNLRNILMASMPA